MLSTIKDHIQQSIDAKQRLIDSPDLLAQIEQAAVMCKNAIEHGHKILIAGNGGSAADAQHIAAELVGRFEKERGSMAGIALTTDTSALTAIANDYGYDKVFSRQIEGLGQPGDVFIGITTSGNSANILSTLDVCKAKSINVIGLTGQKGGVLAQAADICLCVPDTRTAIIQESHIMIGHMLCALIEQ